MKKVQNLKTYYFQCECSSSEHTVGITFDISEKEMAIEVQLASYLGFWKRVVTAIKYVFGYECKYGHWDSAILKEPKVLDLYNLLTRFISTANFDNSPARKIQRGLQNKEHTKLFKNPTFGKKQL